MVPIFDGIAAMSPDTKEWLKVNFDHVFDHLLDCNPKTADEEEEIVVTTACRRWWYYTRDIVPPANGKDFIGDKESFEDHLIPFYLCPIVKKKNHRKHNSHQWFFDSVCLALGNSVNFAFLTDCGTTFEPSCAAILFKELCLNPELIGVTARQRVEWPNKYFHPCEDAPFQWLQGSHEDQKTKQPCWKCYTIFLFGPGPLQGFEFEATLVTNLSIFNLVEALPVMPGPCQLMNWQKMRHFQVVKEYFSLLFKGEINKKEILEIPEHYHKMVDNVSEAGSNDSESVDDSDEEDEMMPVPMPQGFEPMYDDLGTLIHGQMMGLDEAGDPILDVHGKRIPFDFLTKEPIGHIDMPLLPKAGGGRRRRKHHHKGDDMHQPDMNNQTRSSLNFTEFLRTNMRLAEDRVLSFVAVFSTRYGTMWIPGATFYYTPEVKWQTLLLQRRRWINGTFASFLFFLKSKRAKTRLDSRMFDDYSSAKALVLFLWRLQLFQMILVFMSPAIFASAGYISVVDCARRYPEYWSWGNDHIYGTSFRGVDIWIAVCFFIYAGWTFWSHFVQGGRIPETVCHFLACVGVVFMVPVYWSLWGYVAQHGIGFISAIVIFGLVAPAMISSLESWACVYLYLAYLPWFLSLIVFMLIFIPCYSFARLFDTTWGNRATGTDSAIKASEEIAMKNWNLVFIIFLVVSNFAGTAFLIKAYTSGYNVVLAVMVFVFVPALIQLGGAILFWIKTAIYRDMSPSAEQFKHNILPNPSRAADLRRARQEQETGVAILTEMDAAENLDAIEGLLAVEGQELPDRVERMVEGEGLDLHHDNPQKMAGDGHRVGGEYNIGSLHDHEGTPYGGGLAGMGLHTHSHGHGGHNGGFGGHGDGHNGAGHGVGSTGAVGGHHEGGDKHAGHAHGADGGHAGRNHSAAGAPHAGHNHGPGDAGAAFAGAATGAGPSGILKGGAAGGNGMDGSGSGAGYGPTAAGNNAGAGFGGAAGAGGASGVYGAGANGAAGVGSSNAGGASGVGTSGLPASISGPGYKGALKFGDSSNANTGANAAASAANGGVTRPASGKVDGYYGFGPFGYGYYGSNGFYNGLATAPFNNNGDNNGTSGGSGKRRVTFAEDVSVNGDDSDNKSITSSATGVSRGDGSVVSTASSVPPPPPPIVVQLVPPPPPMIPAPPPPIPPPPPATIEEISVATTIDDDPLDKSMWLPTEDMEHDAVAIGIPMDDDYYDDNGQLPDKQDYWYPPHNNNHNNQMMITPLDAALQHDSASTTSSSSSSIGDHHHSRRVSRNNSVNGSSKKSTGSIQSAGPSFQDVYDVDNTMGTKTMIDEHGEETNLVIVADESNPLHEKELLYAGESQSPIRAIQASLLHRERGLDNNKVMLQSSSLDDVDVSPHFMQDYDMMMNPDEHDRNQMLSMQQLHEQQQIQMMQYPSQRVQQQQQQQTMYPTTPSGTLLYPPPPPSMYGNQQQQVPPPPPMPIEMQLQLQYEQQQQMQQHQQYQQQQYQQQQQYVPPPPPYTGNGGYTNDPYSAMQQQPQYNNYYDGQQQPQQYPTGPMYQQQQVPPPPQQPVDPSLDKSALIDPSLANKSIPIQQQAHLQYWNKSSSNAQSPPTSGYGEGNGPGAFRVGGPEGLYPERSMSDTERQIQQAQMQSLGIAYINNGNNNGNGASWQ